MRIVWFVCIGALFLWANDELDDLFVKITTFERKGISATEVQASADPFDYRWRPKRDGNSGSDGNNGHGGHGGSYDGSGATLANTKASSGSPKSSRPMVLAILNNEVKIGKKWIKLGGKYGSWKVVSIGRKGVHLESAKGERRYYAIYEKNTKVIR
ncbi:MAG: hypothetical protein ACTTH5_04225 [Wolinella sp.]